MTKMVQLIWWHSPYYITENFNFMLSSTSSLPLFFDFRSNSTETPALLKYEHAVRKGQQIFYGFVC
jgi:hypothetical protein